MFCERGPYRRGRRDARPEAARGRRRGARRARALGDPGSRRLPYPRLLRRRSSRGVRAARRRERATRSCTRRVAASSPRFARRERPVRPVLRAALERHVGWMLRAGTTTFEAKSGYGLDRDTELAQLRAVRAAGGVPTWLGAHAVPPEFADAGPDGVRRLPPRGGASGSRSDSPRRPMSSSSAALSTSTSPGATSQRLRRGGPGASPARRPVHRVGCDPARDRARRPLGRPPGEHRARPASPRSLRATSSACSFLRARCFSDDRCRRRVRSPTREPRSRWRRTSTPEAPSARACRSSARSPARSSGWRPKRRSPRAP